MSYKLNQFKGIYIHNAKVLYSLGEYSITDFIVSGLDMGQEKVIYLKLPEDTKCSVCDTHVYYADGSLWLTIGFADNMEDALGKVNRMITGAPVYIRSTNRTVCPHCGKVEDVHEYTKYTWTGRQYGNSRAYNKLKSKIYMENGIEVFACEPRVYEKHCDNCTEYDEFNDLPF